MIAHPPASVLRSRTHKRHAAGFWLIAVAYMAAMIFNAIPTPLYPLYQARDGFSMAVVTVVFGVFAFGVAAGLILLGHVSDWIGRKRILIPALVLELIAAVIFLVFPELPGLLIGRLLGGLGVGMIAGTATAHLYELHTAHRPDDGPERFEIVSTGANVGGLAIGPLLGGVLAQYVSAPLRTPYIVSGVLLVLAIVAVVFTPETVKALPVRPSYRPQRVSLNHGNRGAFLTALITGFVAFAITGVYTAISAGFTAGELSIPSHMLAGTVAFVLMGAATLAQTATSRLPLFLRQTLGLGAGMVGLVLLAVGVQTGSLIEFLLAGVLGGAGSGMLTKAAIGAVAALATPSKRGEALSGLFLICYAGMSLPAIGVGIAVLYVGLAVAVYYLSAILLLVLIGAGVAMGVDSARRRRLTSVVTDVGLPDSA
ncbi:MAG: MFS transporter [Lacisediminihabitans sp.]